VYEQETTTLLVVLGIQLVNSTYWYQVTNGKEIAYVMYMYVRYAEINLPNVVTVGSKLSMQIPDIFNGMLKILFPK
jgi:hypothetical protein